MHTTFLPFKYIRVGFFWCLIFPFLLPAFAQKRQTVIYANSKEAYITEGTADKSNWILTPEARPDVYTLSKQTKPTWVTFQTDKEALRVKIRPGRKFDFVVVLKGKDSCYTRLESRPIKDFSHQKPVTHDTLPFVLTAYNNLKFHAIIDHKDTLQLKFDSGATGLILTKDAIEHKTHLSQLSSKTHTLQLEGLKWDSLSIYPVVLSGQGTDGRFGWDLFDGKVLEIDYDHNRMIVHSQLPKVPQHACKLKMEYVSSLFCIKGSFDINGITFENRFLYDNGYQRTIMLDTTILRGSGFPKEVKILNKTRMYNGQGQEVPLITVNSEKLRLGRFSLEDIPAQVMTGSNPGVSNAHIVGAEVLKRFNAILDFQHHHVYLSPSHLWDVPYVVGQ